MRDVFDVHVQNSHDLVPTFIALNIIANQGSTSQVMLVFWSLMEQYYFGIVSIFQCTVSAMNWKWKE